MKRLVILIDGTWNGEDQGLPTNIARLHQKNPENAFPPLILPSDPQGIEQTSFYHAGVGDTPDWLRHLLGGTLGFGLKSIVQDAYKTVVEYFGPGDELYIVGFSRGAYAARALAGLIAKSGILRADVGKDPANLETAWRNYRARRGDRAALSADYDRLKSQDAVHDENDIRAVCVFDTVGSYGVPAGFGLSALARYWAMTLWGFNDTTFSDKVHLGLHAMAIDEGRRPFVPTLWTAPRDAIPTAPIEQTWFAGVHCNIGGGYPDSRLSDIALLWMIARLQALTALKFDEEAVKAATRAGAGDRLDGEVYDSAKGWIIDEHFPARRVLLPPTAIDYGAFGARPNPRTVNINERVHWSALAKRGRPCLYDGKLAPYAPPNLPSDIPSDKIAGMTPEEQALWGEPVNPAPVPPAASSPTRTPA